MFSVTYYAMDGVISDWGRPSLPMENMPVSCHPAFGMIATNPTSDCAHHSFLPQCPSAANTNIRAYHEDVIADIHDESSSVSRSPDTMFRAGLSSFAQVWKSSQLSRRLPI